MGGKAFVGFSDNMICHLDDRGYTHLDQIYILNVPPLYHQCWMPAVDFAFVVGDAIIWDQYIHNLQSSMVRLFDKPDQLLWTKNAKGGSYTPKLGYLALRELEDPPYPHW